MWAQDRWRSWTDLRQRGSSRFCCLATRRGWDGDEATVKQFEGDLDGCDPTNTKQYFAFSKNLSTVMAPSDQAWIKNHCAPAFPR